MSKTAPSMIIREKEPQNLETPIAQVDSYLTPNDLFYIRSHFPVPRLEAAAYQLRIDGAVTKPFSLDYAGLRALPAEKRVATLECAGNSRVFLTPHVEGAQWELGAVGNAEWTGVPLYRLLERAGLEDDACEIILEGADRGMGKVGLTPPHPLAYARSVPREKALQKEVLIAYQMNGRDLPKAHGFPVRAIVPGHYGMASVKWLTHIHAVREPFRGYFQTSDYSHWEYLDGQPIMRALAEMRIKSEIIRPSLGDKLAPGQTYEIFGLAWTGDGEVNKIEVSADGGATWSDGEFIDPGQTFAWRRWRYRWTTPSEPGKCTLMSRARDDQGACQPETHDAHDGVYVINHWLPIEVEIEEPAGI